MNSSFVLQQKECQMFSVVLSLVRNMLEETYQVARLTILFLEHDE